MKFSLRLLEEMAAVVGVAALGAYVESRTGGGETATLVYAAVARALYGFAVKRLGAEDKPSAL